MTLVVGKVKTRHCGGACQPKILVLFVRISKILDIFVYTLRYWLKDLHLAFFGSGQTV